MNKENMGSYLWIIVTTTIMLCLMAFASPFGVYVKNSLEQFAGDFIEKEAEHNVPETERCELKIVYNTADSGKVIDAASVTLKKYEQYSIPSPQIPGYVPNVKTVEGTIYEDTTIYVDYTRGNYSITYVTNNGTFEATLLNAEGKLKTTYTTYKFGDNVVLLDGDDISRGSMNFLGWYDNESFAGSPVTEIKPNEYGNKVYYAKWSSVDYTITYILNDASGQYYYVANENAAGSIAGFDSVVTDSNGNLKSEYTTYSYGTQLKLPTTVHKFGYTFLGWSTEPDGSKVNGNYRAQITETDSGNKVFYAHWKRNTYTITYHTGFIRPTGEKVYYEIKDAQYTVIDSTGRSTTHQGFPTHYTYGDTIILPTQLVLNGYDESNVMEIAWYNKETEKITITSGGDNAGTVNGYPTDAINKTSISPATIGFVLGDHTGHAYDHTDLDLYIMPVPDEYTVTFHPNKPSYASTTMNISQYLQTFLYDEVKGLKANKFALLGYTFTKWNVNADGSGSSYNDKQSVTNLTDVLTKRNGTINLYAQWRRNNYNIEYDLNQGEGTTIPQKAANGSYPTRASFDNSFYVTAPVRDGYTFVGWKVVSGLYEGTAKYGTTSTPGTSISSNTQCHNGTHTGNTYFVNLTPYDEATVVLQAQWVPNGSPSTPFPSTFVCSIVYDLNRGNSSTVPQHGSKAPNTFVFDADIEISNPTMEGYTFTGWTITGLDTDVSHYYGNSTFVVKSNKVMVGTTAATGGTTNASINSTKATHFINLKKHGTVYFKANWTPNTYTISYDLNKGAGTTTPANGSNNPTSATFDVGITVNNPTRTGYTFTGWTISGMDSTKHYYGTTAYTVSNNAINPTTTVTTSTSISSTKATKFINLRCTSGTVTFKANWQANTYTIAYDLNKGSGTSTPVAGAKKPTTGTYDVNVAIDNPTRVGYTFTGWTITGMDSVTHYYGTTAYSISGNAVTPTTTSTTSTSISSTKATNFINLHASKGTVTFKANWTPNVYKITLNKENGSGRTGTGGTSTIYLKYDTGFYSDSACTDAKKIATITAPTLTGYTYNGYWTQSKKAGTKCIDNTSIVMATNIFSADTTIYAGYTANTYTVSFDMNKGKGTTKPNPESKDSITATYDAEFTVSNPTRPNYTFAGWQIQSMSSDCTHYYGTSETTAVSIAATKATTFKNLHSGGGTVSFTAVWTPNVYKITLNKNNGTGGTDEIYQKFDTAFFTSSACTTQTEKVIPPTRVGYIFKGYYTATTGGTQHISADGTILASANTFTGDTTLYAQWTAITYQVKYNGNGATSGSMSNSSHTYDAAKNLTKNAYGRAYTVTYNYNYTGSSNTTATATSTFNGWAESSEGTKKYNDQQSVTNLSSTQGAVVNLYAKWTLGTVTLPTPTRTGYTFGGWYKESSCTNKIGDAGATYTPSSNITLYAKWTANTYQVKYNGNGATSGSMSNSSHTYDVAKNLTKNAYSRAYTVTYNYNYTGSSNTTATATATFNGWATSASGSKVYNDQQSVTNLRTTSGTYEIFANWTLGTVTLPSPTRTGYTFGGWYKESSCTNKVGNGGATYTPSSNTTLYAKWTINQYTATFDANGGSTANPQTITKDYGSQLGTLPTTTRAGYQFNGWYTAKSGGTKISTTTTLTSNVTYYAQWTIINYTVTYDANGGSTASPQSVTRTYNQDLGTLATTSRTGYTFDGWYTAKSGGTKATTTTKITSNVTLYAHWTIKQYTATFDANGGSAASPGTITKDYGSQLGTLPTTSRSGYSFDGWFTAASGGTQISSTTTLTSDVTYYAHWTINTVTATFNPNGGSTPNPQTKTITIGGQLGTLPTTTRDGYSFDGWFTAASGGSQISSSTTISTNTTYYAHWTEVHSHNWTSQGNKAGCESTGSTLYSCSCGEIKWEGTIASAGHLSTSVATCNTHHNHSSCSNGGQHDTWIKTYSCFSESGHEACGHDDKYKTTGYTDVYCGRENAPGGSSYNSAIYGNTYYCGYRKASGCWTHVWYTTAKVTFYCPGAGSGKNATGAQIRSNTSGVIDYR